MLPLGLLALLIQNALLALHQFCQQLQYRGSSYRRFPQIHLPNSHIRVSCRCVALPRLKRCELMQEALVKPIGPRRGMVMPLHLPMIAISSQKSMQTTPRMPQATPLCCSFTNVLDLSGRTIIRVCPFALLEWSDSQYICGLACLECAGRWWSWWWCWPCIVWRMGQRPAFEPSSMPLFARSWLKGGNNDIKSSPERGTKSTGDSLSRLNSIRNASITLRASIIRNFAGMVWWQTVTHASSNNPKQVSALVNLVSGTWRRNNGRQSHPGGEAAPGRRRRWHTA